MIDRAKRPGSDEYAPDYGLYIDRVGDGDVVETLRRQRDETHALLAGIPPEKSSHRYAEGKWSVAQVVRHVVDCEWVFAGRALLFARANPGPLPGIDQNDLMAAVEGGLLDLPSMIDELHHLRTANIAHFERLPAAAFDRRGIASESDFTVRALLWILAGHEAHHIDVLKERYL